MGQGEPLHNYDAVMRAIDVLTDDRGLSLAASRITLSTVGLVRAFAGWPGKIARFRSRSACTERPTKSAPHSCRSRDAGRSLH